MRDRSVSVQAQEYPYSPANPAILPELDPELAAALATGTDVTRVTAAEAILILVGPETVAEYD